MKCKKRKNIYTLLMSKKCYLSNEALVLKILCYAKIIALKQCLGNKTKMYNFRN